MLSASSAGSSVEHSIPGDYQLRRPYSRLAAAGRGTARLDLVESLLPPDGDALALDAAGGSGIVSGGSDSGRRDRRFSGRRVSGRPGAEATSACRHRRRDSPAVSITRFFEDYAFHQSDRAPDGS